MRLIIGLFLCSAALFAADSKADKPLTTDQIARSFNHQLLVAARAVSAKAPAQPADADPAAPQLRTKWGKYWLLAQMAEQLERDLDPKNKRDQVLRVEVFNALQDVEQGR